MKKNNQNNNSVLEKYYPNSDICKAQILSENKNKSGVYMWTNFINGKKYIGSAINLSNRLSFYYSVSALENTLKNNQS
jgi:excinuclease UvrABC nuclease subunit